MEAKMQSMRNRLLEFSIKLAITGAVMLVAGMPTWLFLIARYMVSPEGFWQNLVLGAVGIWFLGGLQIFLAICAVVFLVSFWLG